MNNITRPNVANWKFYAKRTIEEEEVWFREGRGRRTGEGIQPLECVNAVAVRALCNNCTFSTFEARIVKRKQIQIDDNLCCPYYCIVSFILNQQNNKITTYSLCLMLI